MKKVFFAILLLASTQLGAQTALYKAFLGKNGINACCIPDYPIGDKTTVTVTLLQADDSATFKTLMRQVKEGRITAPLNSLESVMGVAAVAVPFVHIRIFLRGCRIIQLDIVIEHGQNGIPVCGLIRGPHIIGVIVRGDIQPLRHGSRTLR